MLQKHVCRDANRPNKGVHQQNPAVLRLTSMPACLIELGYISTPDEERFLNNKQSIDIMGRAIYNAFAEYKNKYDKGITVPFKTMSEQLPEPAEAPAEAPKTRATDSTPDNVAQQKQEDNVIVQPSQNEPRPTPRKQVERKPERVQNNAPIDNSRPVFKIQILVSKNRYKAGDKIFKGLEDIDCYEESGLYKYTCGASNNYNTVYKRLKEVGEDFNGAFIIAFKNGEKINVNAGIREFKNNR